ncbi:unnamed protein product [Effrenium voratum]|nr:unnamed protein product [Effrenium voratum]
MPRHRGKWPLALLAGLGGAMVFAGQMSSRVVPRVVRRAEDTMGELFTKYYRLQEVNRNLEADTKIATVSELLEILDDLERGASQDGGTGGASTLQTLASKFAARLESMGFERIKASGAFDPRRHEAAAQRPEASVSSGDICEELRSGWMLGDRVVRPAVVTVAA